MENMRDWRVAVHGWAGLTLIPVEIRGETPKMIRVRFLTTAYRFYEGEERLVPKGSMRKCVDDKWLNWQEYHDEF